MEVSTKDIKILDEPADYFGSPRDSMRSKISWHVTSVLPPVAFSKKAGTAPPPPPPPPSGTSPRLLPTRNAALHRALPGRRNVRRPEAQRANARRAVAAHRRGGGAVRGGVHGVGETICNHQRTSAPRGNVCFCVSLPEKVSICASKSRRAPRAEDSSRATRRAFILHCSSE